MTESINPETSSPESESSVTGGDARLYQSAVLASPDAFIAFDDQYRIIEWCAHASEIFGWRAAEVLGRSLSDSIIPLPFAEQLHQEIASLSHQGISDWPAARRRVTACRSTGETFTAELQLSTLEIDGRRYFTSFIRDLSDTMLAEQQLVQAQKLEAIGQLTGGLAHDFNNILGIIIGTLDLVRPTVAGKQESELLSAALAAAHRGADVTRALLAVARRRALKPQPTNVNELIDELAPLLRQSAGKNIEMTFSANAIDAVCNIDAGGLNNALVNLVINARDAMPRGGHILVYAYSTAILPKSLMVPLELKPGPYLVIGVDDSGSGMDTEVAMRAFDPFFTTKARGQGTGLGLAMVYGFARQSGGTARIQSALGQGSSVQLLIPAIADPAPLQKSPLSSGAEKPPRGHGRILIVDDETPLLQIAYEWLRGLGYAVTTAAAASEALTRLAEDRFDLLISDIIMPGAMDGIALLERCRRLYPEMTVLLTTGYSEGLTANLPTAHPVLEKPYTRASLGQAVADALYAKPHQAPTPG